MKIEDLRIKYNFTADLSRGEQLLLREELIDDLKNTGIVGIVYSEESFILSIRVLTTPELLKVLYKTLNVDFV